MYDLFLRSATQAGEFQRFGEKHLVDLSTLDKIGKLVLHYTNYRVVGLAILVIVAVLCLWRRAINPHERMSHEVHKVLFALLIFSSGVITLCVFLLTSPPAYEEISNEGKILLGTLVPIVCFSFCWREVRDFLRPPNDEDRPPAPRPSILPPGRTVVTAPPKPKPKKKR